MPGGAIAAILQTFLNCCVDTWLSQDCRKMAAKDLLPQQGKPRFIGTDKALGLINQDARHWNCLQKTCHHLLFHCEPLLRSGSNIRQM
jgi:hypothetical protein